MEERKKAIMAFFATWGGWHEGPKSVARYVKFPVVNIREDLKALAEEGKLKVVSSLIGSDMPQYALPVSEEED